MLFAPHFCLLTRRLFLSFAVVFLLCRLHPLPISKPFEIKCIKTSSTTSNSVQLKWSLLFLFVVVFGVVFALSNFSYQSLLFLMCLPKFSIQNASVAGLHSMRANYNNGKNSPVLLDNSFPPVTIKWYINDSDT